MRSKIYRYIRTLIITFALLVLPFMLIAAQEPAEDWFPTSLEDLIAKLSAPSWIVGVVAAVLAVVSEYGLKWYDDLATKYKRAVYLAMCMVLPAAGVILQMTVLKLPLTWAVILTAAQAGWAAFGLGTAVQGILPKRVGTNWIIRGH